MSQLVPFDDRDGFIWMNGEMVPWREAKIHVLTHGLHYGSCVFEGERCYNGKVFKSTEHSQRLIDSGRILGFEVPYSVEELNAAKDALIQKMGFKNCYVRPLAWRGSEQMGVSAQKSRINVAIAVWEWGAYYSDLRLTKAVYDRPAPNTAPVHAKAAGLYMICTISKHAAEAKGFGDALMLDYRGYIAETTGANIFLVKNGEIHTPKPDCFLNGITRRTVIDLARKRGYEVIERHILPDEVRDAQEIFVTGTAAEVTPVRAIDDLSYQVGPVTRQLMEDFHNLTRGDAKAA
ncbi:branched-chain amino acid aminotransferase [Benzoatithermus flavus]|uniref:Branched-chain-amino-acid aminotransferase n=1 Tax=Benzoatithermus flavus TaxID=3108223 RepID=A0ABU8XNE5_9PROT